MSCPENFHTSWKFKEWTLFKYIYHNLYCTIVFWNSTLVTSCPSDQRWTTMTETLLLIVDQYLHTHTHTQLILGPNPHFIFHQWFNLRVFFQGGGAVKHTVWPALPEEECKQTGGPASIQTETPRNTKAALSKSRKIERGRKCYLINQIESCTQTPLKPLRSMFF